MGAVGVRHRGKPEACGEKEAREEARRLGGCSGNGQEVEEVVRNWSSPPF